MLIGYGVAVLSLGGIAFKFCREDKDMVSQMMALAGLLLVTVGLTLIALSAIT